MSARLDALNRAWASVSAQIGAIMGGLNTQCFEAVAHFISSAAHAADGSDSGAAVKAAYDPDWPRSITQQIPAALGMLR
jgi:hypothetical protein